MTTTAASDAFRGALALLQTGKVREAEKLFKALVTAEPKHIAGLNVLGILLVKAGKFAEAEGYIRRAINEDASSDVSFYNYGIVLKALKRPQEALEQFSQALKINPAVPETWNNRGTVFKDLGRHSEAIADFDKAISLNPNYADANCNKAGALFELEQYAEALAAYDRALHLRGDLTEAWLGRGAVYNELKQHDKAIAAYNQALSMKPDLAEAWFGRGIAYTNLKRFDDAFADYDRALSFKPGLVGAWLGRGVAYTALKRYDEAFAAYDRALRLSPKQAEAWAGRGNLHSELGQHDDALIAYERALSLKADLNHTAGFRVHTKMRLCNWTNIEADFDHILALIRDQKPIGPFIPLSLPSSPADQLNCAKVFANQVSFKQLWRGEIYSHDRIRVAYLSADFHEHPVAQLTVGLFERHDTSRFEVTAVSYGPERDSPLRQRIRGAAEHFIDAGTRQEEEIAEIIRRHEIDIAVDLMGFTDDNRFGVLARRPAPIQVNYLGYPGTMGTSCIDYILADPTIIPDDQWQYYTERVVWIPASYQVNDRQRVTAEVVPSRRECGLPDDGFVFCAFNASYKITPMMFDIWMRLLRQVEGSVLWLRQMDSATTHNLYREAEQRGVAADRLIFAPYEPDYATHLARYRQADLFLDTMPFNAHATASDALWAGIPVLTCVGATFAGRVTASVLKSIGLDDLVAHSLEEYEALALHLAREPSYLGSLRNRLADNRETFPLFDAERATRGIEAVFTNVWERYQRGETPQTAPDGRRPIRLA